MIRLQKFIAECGVSSRRQAEKFICEGKVSINGKVVKELGTKIDPQKDHIKVSGKTIKPHKKKIYIMLHKPVGYETTCKGSEKKVLDLVKVKERVFPVGRLDKDSSGLLILTNDGEYANKMMHPRYEHEKEYLVQIEKPANKQDLKKLEIGVMILGKKTFPAKVKVLSDKKISIIIHEGRNRQVRRMFEAVGNKVLKLKRIRLDKLKLGNLPPGKWKYISAPVT